MLMYFNRGNFKTGNYLTAVLLIFKVIILGNFDSINPVKFYILESSILSSMRDGKFNVGSVGTVNWNLLRVRFSRLLKSDLYRADISFNLV